MKFEAFFGRKGEGGEKRGRSARRRAWGAGSRPGGRALTEIQLSPDLFDHQ